jgi:hypothetical protein
LLYTKVIWHKKTNKQKTKTNNIKTKEKTQQNEYLPANNPINYVYDWNCFSHFIDYERIIEYFKISRFI